MVSERSTPSLLPFIPSCFFIIHTGRILWSLNATEKVFMMAWKKVEEPFILRVPNLSFKIPLLLFPGLQRGWETLGTPFIFFSASNYFYSRPRKLFLGCGTQNENLQNCKDSYFIQKNVWHGARNLLPITSGSLKICLEWHCELGTSDFQWKWQEQCVTHWGKFSWV